MSDETQIDPKVKFKAQAENDPNAHQVLKPGVATAIVNGKSISINISQEWLLALQTAFVNIMRKASTMDGPYPYGLDTSSGRGNYGNRKSYAYAPTMLIWGGDDTDRGGVYAIGKPIDASVSQISGADNYRLLSLQFLLENAGIDLSQWVTPGGVAGQTAVARACGGFETPIFTES